MRDRRSILAPLMSGAGNQKLAFALVFARLLSAILVIVRVELVAVIVLAIFICIVVWVHAVAAVVVGSSSHFSLHSKVGQKIYGDVPVGPRNSSAAYAVKRSVEKGTRCAVLF